MLFQNVRQTNENKFLLKNYNINFDFNNIMIILNIIRRVSNKTYILKLIITCIWYLPREMRVVRERLTRLYSCAYTIRRVRANNALPRYNIVCPWRKRSKSLIFLYTYVKRTV